MSCHHRSLNESTQSSYCVENDTKLLDFDHIPYLKVYHFTTTTKRSLHRVLHSIIFPADVVFKVGFHHVYHYCPLLAAQYLMITSGKKKVFIGCCCVPVCKLNLYWEEQMEFDVVKLYLFIFLIEASYQQLHHWFSGKISRCHRDALGSIPGWCNVIPINRLLMHKFLNFSGFSDTTCTYAFFINLKSFSLTFYRSHTLFGNFLSPCKTELPIFNTDTA